MPEKQQLIDDIWADDMFDREAEAALLIGYLESVAVRTPLREDSHGFTLAVDAPYGEGKSFFLKRLARQLELDHPVAFVDAWTDDLADEPLTALAATLKRALHPLIDASAEVGSKFKDVLAKSGKIAKIVGGGLVKRAIALAITSVAADALEGAISGLDDEVEDVVKEQLKTAGNDIVTDGSAALTSVAPGKLMEGRIAAFEEGQDAIRDMRASLEALVASLEGGTQTAPIFIIIDELDRCRPTYAVKLLEEIKHLFDVPGLIFILGLHGDQLAHSVSAAYGSEFDGKGYLRRFFHRQYRLAEVDLNPLLDHLFSRMGIATGPGLGLRFVIPGEGRAQLSIAQTTARYMAAYGLSARNAFEVADILQTCFALAGRKGLYLNYLLPLVIAHVQGQPAGTLPKAEKPIPWQVFEPTDSFGNDGFEIGPEELALLFQQAGQYSRSELARLANVDNPGLAIRAAYETSPTQGEGERLWSIANYPKMLTTVSRFKNPEIAQD